MMTGTLSRQLNSKPDTPAPIEIPHTHDVTIPAGRLAACAAWKKITSGPEYEISTARKPAVIADSDHALPARSAGLWADEMRGSCMGW
ncbi:hypothetical protein GCM10027081_38640 [Cupriavidus yeoncheonensis]